MNIMCGIFTLWNSLNGVEAILVHFRGGLELICYIQLHKTQWSRANA